MGTAQHLVVVMPSASWCYSAPCQPSEAAKEDPLGVTIGKNEREECRVGGRRRARYLRRWRSMKHERWGVERVGLPLEIRRWNVRLPMRISSRFERLGIQARGVSCPWNRKFLFPSKKLPNQHSCWCVLLINVYKILHKTTLRLA